MIRKERITVIPPKGLTFFPAEMGSRFKKARERVGPMDGLYENKGEQDREKQSNEIARQVNVARNGITTEHYLKKLITTWVQ